MELFVGAILRSFKVFYSISIYWEHVIFVSFNQKNVTLAEFIHNKKYL